MDAQEIIDPQPLPRHRPGATSMHDLAAQLHRMRGEHGWEKYHSRLQTYNGREAQVDMIQESLDRLVYELQAYLEGKAREEAMQDFRRWVNDYGGPIPSEVILDELENFLNPLSLYRRAEHLIKDMLDPS